MAYIEFNNNEAGFEKWAQAHQFGVVINSSPGRLNLSYVKAHRPACNSFQRHPGAKTVYSKHCFDSAIEAIEYIKTKGPQKPSFGCKTCKVSALEPTSDVHEFEKSIKALWMENITSVPPGNRTPSRSETAISTLIERDPAVAFWVRREANGRCELCTSKAPFLTNDGRPYLEVHHVKELANKGPDTPDNTVALCPNCHRAMHYSSEKVALIAKIYETVPRLVL